MTNRETQRRLDDSETIIRDMAEELSFCYESLSAIFRCSAELGKTNNLEDFARRLLSDLAQITSADWFIFRTCRKGESQLEMFVSFGLKHPATCAQHLPKRPIVRRSRGCHRARRCVV